MLSLLAKLRLMLYMYDLACHAVLRGAWRWSGARLERKAAAAAEKMAGQCGPELGRLRGLRKQHCSKYMKMRLQCCAHRAAEVRVPESVER